jgi:hypothetical protein
MRAKIFSSSPPGHLHALLMVIVGLLAFQPSVSSAQADKLGGDPRVFTDLDAMQVMPAPVFPEQMLFRDNFGPFPGRAPDCPGPLPPPELEIHFDWTHCQVHRLSLYEPIVMLLNGNYHSTAPNTWKLWASAPVSGGEPILYFQQAVPGQTGPAYGVNIPLAWAISINGGPFIPFTLLPDHSLMTVLPTGLHTFQVRITATPQPHQDDGYYKLILSQTLLPQL